MPVKKRKARSRKSAAKGRSAARPLRDLSTTKSGASAVRGGFGIFKATHDKREAGSENT
jgi:hypothetical protein